MASYEKDRLGRRLWKLKCPYCKKEIVSTSRSGAVYNYELHKSACSKRSKRIAEQKTKRNKAKKKKV